MSDLFTTYQDTYLAIRAEHGHPEAPVLYRDWVYCETLPPKGWSHARYAPYSDAVTRLTGWYLAARDYAGKRRKTTADRDAYLAACDQYCVAGHDLRFAGEPQLALF